MALRTPTAAAMNADPANPAAPAVLLSGGGGTIGAEIAVALGGGGHPVAVADLDLEGAERTAARVLAAGGRAVAIELDVRSQTSWADAAGSAAAWAGRVGVLINAAGIEGRVAPLADYPPEEFEAVMDVNARGTFLGLRALLPSMSEAGGRIVNVSSTAGLVGVAGMAAYVASKHAVIGLTRTAAAEYGSRGVQVNAVCPGPTEGRMIESLERGRGDREPKRARARFLRAIPQRRYGEPGEVAASVAFLASSAAGFVNGAVLAVDGGMTAI